MSNGLFHRTSFQMMTTERRHGKDCHSGKINTVSFTTKDLDRFKSKKHIVLPQNIDLLLKN